MNLAPANSIPAVLDHTLPSALHPEWSILLAACSVIPAQKKQDRLRTLLQQPIDWKSLFALADRHGTQPLLHQALSQLQSAVPAEEMRQLQQSHQSNLHKALLLSRELIHILEHLSALGIEALPYKGLAVAEALYGDIALRQSGDIDLLIRPQDLPRVREAVRQLGYTPHASLSEAHEHAYLESGYEFSFDGAAGPNLLEVQWAIQPRFYAIDFDMPGLFQRATAINVAGQPMKTPSHEDLFLILSAHAAKHVWGRLIWLCDLARLMHLPNLNWPWIASQAQVLGIVRILSVTMLATRGLLAASIPTPAAEAGLVADDFETRTLVGEVQTHITSESTFNVESLAYFRLMMRLRERRADRLRFLRRLIFTPGPSEWDAVRLPKPLFSLYRLVRLSRLAARLVRA